MRSTPTPDLQLRNDQDWAAAGLNIAKKLVNTVFKPRSRSPSKPFPYLCTALWPVIMRFFRYLWLIGRTRGSSVYVDLYGQMSYNFAKAKPTPVRLPMLNKPETQDKTRNARLEARVSSDQKDFFQRAATLTGRTLSELVIDSTQEAAAKIVQEHEVIRLSREEQVAFVNALLTDAEPGGRIKQAVLDYRQRARL
jgi:uncharacterized protein (DUF1778 family)